MDIRLPIMDGYEATRRIKEFTKIPVIAQTAYGSDSDKVKAINAGCDDFVSKPINRERLLQTIQKYID